MKKTLLFLALLLFFNTTQSFGQSIELTPSNSILKANELYLGDPLPAGISAGKSLLFLNSDNKENSAIFKNIVPTQSGKFGESRLDINVNGTSVPSGSKYLVGIKQNLSGNLITTGRAFFFTGNSDEVTGNSNFINNANAGLISNQIRGNYTSLYVMNPGFGFAIGDQIDINSSLDNSTGVGIVLSGYGKEKIGVDVDIRQSALAPTSVSSIGAKFIIEANSEKTKGILINVKGAEQENLGLDVTATGVNPIAARFTGKTEHVGFTSLGGPSSPAIKMIEIANTMPAANTSKNFAHNLTGAKILSVSILADVSGQFIPPNYTGNTNLEYNYYMTGTDLFLLNKSSNSSALAGVPCKILITYKE